MISKSTTVEVLAGVRISVGISIVCRMEFSKAKSEERNLIIDSNIKVAKNLGLRGTPASIVNDTIFPGYVKLAKLKKIISQ